eukprot:gene11928-10303_t
MLHVEVTPDSSPDAVRGWLLQQGFDNATVPLYARELLTSTALELLAMDKDADKLHAALHRAKALPSEQDDPRKIQRWLLANDFGGVVPLLAQKPAASLLRMSRQDLVKLVPGQGGALYAALHDQLVPESSTKQVQQWMKRRGFKDTHTKFFGKDGADVLALDRKGVQDLAGLLGPAVFSAMHPTLARATQPS